MNKEQNDFLILCERRAANAKFRTVEDWTEFTADVVVGHKMVGNVQGRVVECIGIDEAEADFLSNASKDIVSLCRLVKEEDKRARHAEQERNMYDARIAELEAEVAKLKRGKLVGYRLRWHGGITGITSWYAPEVSAAFPSGGTMFATVTEARQCLATLNDGWRDNAKIVRVVRRKIERKDKP